MTPISAQDAKDLARILVLAPIAWIAPQRAWHAVAATLSNLQAKLSPQHARDLAERVPGYLAEASGISATALAEDEIASSYLEEMAILRFYRPGGWHPSIRLEGRQHLDAALAAGKGAILWVEDMHFASLVVKMAFARYGYQVSHLSRPSHGFSNTPFAHRYLNPIRWRFEDRHLKQRFVLVGTDPAVLRHMRNELAVGGIVSITVGNNGSQLEAVPFFDAELDFASGAVTLARATGAPLLPVFTTRLASGAFEVRIEAPLDVGEGRDDITAFRQFAALLADYVTEHPLQWKGWAYRGPPSSGEDTRVPRRHL